MKSGGVLTALAVSAIYLGIIFFLWLLLGVDYTRLSSQDRVLSDLVVPLAVGALFLVGVVTWLGWWRPVMSEAAAARPKWTVWVVGLGMACFILLNLLTTDWGEIAPVHLIMLLLAGALVGFNEEILFRGINVVGFRREGFGETWVWLGTSLVFGLAHLPNGFFGTGLGGAVGQAMIVVLAASSYYLLRRVSGSLVVPAVFHGLWDFSLFAQAASGAPSPAIVLAPLSLFVSLLGIFFVILVLRRAAKDPASAG